jgi:hypothetical protein
MDVDYGVPMSNAGSSNQYAARPKRPYLTTQVEQESQTPLRYNRPRLDLTTTSEEEETDGGGDTDTTGGDQHDRNVQWMLSDNEQDYNQDNGEEKEEGYNQNSYNESFNPVINRQPPFVPVSIFPQRELTNRSNNELKDESWSVLPLSPRRNNITQQKWFTSTGYSLVAPLPRGKRRAALSNQPSPEEQPPSILRRLDDGTTNSSNINLPRQPPNEMDQKLQYALNNLNLETDAAEEEEDQIEEEEPPPRMSQQQLLAQQRILQQIQLLNQQLNSIWHNIYALTQTDPRYNQSQYWQLAQQTHNQLLRLQNSALSRYRAFGNRSIRNLPERQLEYNLQLLRQALEQETQAYHNTSAFSGGNNTSNKYNSNNNKNTMMNVRTTELLQQVTPLRLSDQELNELVLLR